MERETTFHRKVNNNIPFQHVQLERGKGKNTRYLLIFIVILEHDISLLSLSQVVESEKWESCFMKLAQVIPNVLCRVPI